MPSGPPELHEKWSAYGPSGCGDHNAMNFLQSRGFILSRKWEWFHPLQDKTLQTLEEDEYEAICYLVWEWDFGSFRPGPMPPEER